jgi:hypothetical protein
MKAKIFFFFMVLCFSQSANSQIHSPGSFGDVTVTAAQINAAHVAVESWRARARITSITSTGGTGPCSNTSSCTATLSTTDFWPAGSWYDGYYDIILAPGAWCTGHPAGFYEYSGRPLVRNSEDQSRAYLHLDNLSPSTTWSDRMNWGADYLAHTAQRNTVPYSSSGGWIYWLKRGSCTTPSAFNEANDGLNFQDQYESSRGLRAVLDAYWYKLKNEDPTAGDLYSSIEHGANWILNSGDGPNSNYQGFMAWALAGAYKVTGDPRYYLRAKYLCELIMSHQEPITAGVWAGTWRTGSTDVIPGSSPSQSVNHDTHIWYHEITVRGLIETMSITPSALSTFQTDLRESIELAVNHVVDYRFNPSGNNLSVYYLSTTGAPIQPAVQRYVIFDNEWISVLAKLAQTDPNYTATDRTNLESIMNRMALGMSTTEVEYFKQLAFYADYSDAMNSSRTIDKTVQADFELLQKYNSLSKIYTSDDATTLSLGYNPIYTGTSTLDKWIAGDFDGDGRDELLYKFTGNTIYRSDNPANLPTGVGDQVYSGSSALENWIVADFDGNGDDELLYKFVGSNDILFSEDAMNLSAGTNVYSPATYALERWIIGDFNGNNREEVLFKFVGLNTIFHDPDGQGLATSTSIYSGPGILENWIVADFSTTGGLDGDEFLYKFSSNGTVYRNNGTTLFSGTVVTTFTGATTIDKWIVGDFDGNLDDELLYKLTGAKTCYFSEDGDFVAPTTIYSGTYNLENWIVADFDGNRNEEVINKFVGLNKIYRSDDAQALGSQMLLYDGTYALGQWIALKFDGGTDALKQIPSEPGLISVQDDFSLVVYPNPNNGAMKVNFYLPADGFTKITLTDAMGKEVATLADEHMPQGASLIEWEKGGQRIVPGIYFLIIEWNGRQLVSRVSILD